MATHPVSQGLDARRLAADALEEFNPLVSRLLIALSGVRGVLRSKHLRRVELAWAASITAEWMHFVALGVFAYRASGTLGVGIAGLIRVLPAACIAPFAAFLGDRFRRERFLLAIAVGGCAALAGSAAAYFAGRHGALIFALAAVVGLASTLIRPAQAALLPSLARTPDELIAANGATSTIEGLGTLVGPLAAALLVSIADPGLAFGIAAVAMLAAAFLFSRVRVEGRVRVAATASAASAREGLLAGFRTVSRERKSRLVVGLVLAQSFVRGCLNVLIVVTAFRVLHSGAGAVGYMTAALGVGGLVGAVGAFTLSSRRLAVPFGVALVFWGLPIALVAPRPYLVVAVVLLAVVGAANAIEDVAALTLLQRVVPDEVLTRVLAVLWGLAMGGVALGSIVAPAVVKGIGPRLSLIVVGAILPLLTLTAWRRLVDIDRTVVAPARELALIDGVPMFAPLSIAAKERMAATLAPVSVTGGDTVIRAGDAGDRFYIVGNGELEVLAPGRRVTARAGDYFGEIALLRDVRRTATVKALVDSELYALGRDDFLAAVTSHSAVRAAGDQLVEERLSSELHSSVG
jgi:MFS family permease